MRFRLATPQDNEQIKAIFEKQKIEAHLPLPGQDPCVAVAVVGEEDGRIKAALVGRLAVEAHLVIAPDEKHQVSTIRELKDFAEGAMLQASRQMQTMGFPAVEDVMAFVPKKMTKMQILLEYLGFRQEPDTFQGFWKKIGF